MIFLLSAKSSNSKIIKPTLIGVLVSIVSSLIMLVIFAVALTNLSLPDSAVLVLSLISMGIGAFAGGIAAAKIYKERGFVIGAINGAAFYMLSTLVSLAVNPEALTIISLIKLIIFILSSTLGGILGVNLTHKNKI